LDASFGYTGHYFHQPSGLNLATYRAYSATLGRWISRDPIGERGGINLYGYVENDPIRRIDPLGLRPSSGFNCGIEEWHKWGCRVCSAGGGYAQYVSWVCTTCLRNC